MSSSCRTPSIRENSTSDCPYLPGRLPFQLLKRERIRRKIYLTRDEARADVFDYIELFYNPKRRHSHNDQLSPVEF